jgi:hypothetical protein
VKELVFLKALVFALLAQVQLKPNGIVFRRWSLLMEELKTLVQGPRAFNFAT